MALVEQILAMVNILFDSLNKITNAENEVIQNASNAINEIVNSEINEINEVAATAIDKGIDVTVCTAKLVDILSIPDKVLGDVKKCVKVITDEVENIINTAIATLKALVQRVNELLAKLTTCGLNIFCIAGIITDGTALVTLIVKTLVDVGKIGTVVTKALDNIVNCGLDIVGNAVKNVKLVCSEIKTCIKKL